MKKANSPNASNVSLVAFYANKPVELCNLIIRLQKHLANHRLLQEKFVPYQIAQVHGTIVGCEGAKNSKGIISRWFKERREEKYVDFLGLINYLQQQAYLPLVIRFGGYNRQTNYNFSSRSQHLYDRSFQLQSVEDRSIPVLIGWSWSHNAVTLAIDNLRRSFQQFGLLHKYHINDDSIDNDFYLRLGTVETQLSSEEIKAIAVDLCQLLETNPVYIPVKFEDLAFVQYHDLQLTPATTRVIPLTSIDADQLERLYSN